ARGGATLVGRAARPPPRCPPRRERSGQGTPATSGGGVLSSSDLLSVGDPWGHGARGAEAGNEGGVLPCPARHHHHDVLPVAGEARHRAGGAGPEPPRVDGLGKRKGLWGAACERHRPALPPPPPE